MTATASGWQPIETLPEWPEKYYGVWLLDIRTDEVWQRDLSDWHAETRSMILARGNATHWQPVAAPAGPGDE